MQASFRTATNQGTKPARNSRWSHEIHSNSISAHISESCWASNFNESTMQQDFVPANPICSWKNEIMKNNCRVFKVLRANLWNLRDLHALLARPPQPTPAFPAFFLALKNVSSSHKNVSSAIWMLFFLNENENSLSGRVLKADEDA